MQVRTLYRSLEVAAGRCGCCTFLLHFLHALTLNRQRRLPAFDRRFPLPPRSPAPDNVDLVVAAGSSLSVGRQRLKAQTGSCPGMNAVNSFGASSNLTARHSCQRVETALRARVAAGEWKSDERLPPVAELAVHYGSRGLSRWPRCDACMI